jgi:fructosamine-3-kinase
VREHGSQHDFTAGESTLSEELPWDSADYLKWVLDDSGDFPDLPALNQMTAEQVVSLRGGVDAATYLVKCPDRDVVVKLSSRGLEAEAKALAAWKAYTPRVPAVLGLGTVPATGDLRIKYLLLAALKNDRGQVVETAAEYLARSPGSAGELGCAVGAELHLLHQAVDRTGFGNFADARGSERTYSSWSAYLEDFFALYAGFVKQLGIPEDRIQAVRGFVARCPFVPNGRFLHGDVTIRNVGVYSYAPITVCLFDPNPLSGDPSWDIAPMINNAAFNEIRYRLERVVPEPLERDRALAAAFSECYPGKVAEESLLTAQLLQAVLQAEYRQNRLNRGQTDILDVEVTHQFIRDVVDRMAA